MNYRLQGTTTKTSFEDARCKCICPKFKENENTTVNERTVFISANADPNKWYVQSSAIVDSCAGFADSCSVCPKVFYIGSCKFY